MTRDGVAVRHYSAAGTPDPKGYIRAHTRLEGECWIWTAYTDRQGYASVALYDADGSRHRRRAHRWAYQLYRGPIPEGLVTDHLCRRTSCVNPWHLEIVTVRENLLRGNSIQAQNARKRVCKNGHPFDHIRRDGARGCSVCQRRRVAA